jgi:biopolymer transport protein ExbB
MMMIENRVLNLSKVAVLALVCVVGAAGFSGISYAQDAATADVAQTAIDGEVEADPALLEGAAEGAVDEMVPAVEEPAPETVENPYGLAALWNQGDIVAKGTLLVLLLMSIGSWYIIFSKLFEQRRVFDQSNKVAKIFAPTDTLKEGLDALPKRNSFRLIAEEGFESSEQFRKGLSSEVTLTAWSDTALGRAIERFGQKLQSGLAFLATVGSTAPFVGLFGTVWGIYHALVAIGVSGQASIDKVAGPVGESLIMTAIGLAVAVPAVLGYNWLVRRNKAVLARARLFAEEVHLRIASGRAA